MIKFENGDVTKAVPDEGNILLIPHVVNSHGIMGSGVAWALMNRWIEVHDNYVKWFNRNIYNDKLRGGSFYFDLGEIQLVPVEENIIVVNMVAQKFGEDKILGRNIPPIRIAALEECIERVSDFIERNKDQSFEIAAPKFGSLRAGGDWDKDIFPLIKKHWDWYKVTIYEYN